MSWPEMDGWRLERVLRLACLLDSGMRATPEELAEQLGIKRRMFFLDLVLLIRLGYTAQYSRKLGRYELIEPDAGIPPHEIYALARGVAAMAKIDGTAHEAISALNLLSNLQIEMGPQEGRYLLESMINGIVSRGWDCPVEKVLAAAAAIRDRMQLALRSDVTSEWHYYSPAQLAFAGGRPFIEDSRGYPLASLGYSHLLATAPLVAAQDENAPLAAEAQDTAGSAGGKKQNTDMSPAGAGAQT